MDSCALELRVECVIGTTKATPTPDTQDNGQWWRFSGLNARPEHEASPSVSSAEPVVVA